MLDRRDEPPSLMRDANPEAQRCDDLEEQIQIRLHIVILHVACVPIVIGTKSSFVVRPTPAAQPRAALMIVEPARCARAARRLQRLLGRFAWISALVSDGRTNG
jgi:hypothetical protein